MNEVEVGTKVMEKKVEEEVTVDNRLFAAACLLSWMVGGWWGCGWLHFFF